MKVGVAQQVDDALRLLGLEEEEEDGGILGIILTL